MSDEATLSMESAAYQGDFDYLSFRLSDEFISGYVERPVNWGFPIGAGNTLGEITFYATYSRVKPDGTKERWYEACRRVVEGTYSILKDHCMRNRTPWNHAKAARAAEDMYERMFTFRWTPPGRGIWMMGTRFVHEEGSAALQNCGTARTRFLTSEGIRLLGEEVGNEATIWAGEDHGWMQATIQEFGVQPIQRITFAPSGLRSNHRVVEEFTPDHRWYLRDGSVTTNLKVGDVVPAAATMFEVGGEDYDAGFKHGLAFADGTIHYRYVNGDYGMMMRLCGDKAEHVKVFDRHHFQPNCGGDPVAYDRFSFNFKEVPDASRSLSYQRGFLDGWREFDGWEKPSGSFAVSTQDAVAATWLIDNAALLGAVVTGHNVNTRPTNYGERSAPLHNVSMAFAVGRHWTVVGIDVLDEPEPVYCAVVPGAERFTLASGVLTGNCAFVSTKTIGPRNPTMPFARLMEMSMLGVGVGFDTLGAGGLTIHAPVGDAVLHVIDDSREGWVASQEALLRSYFVPGQKPVNFDYSGVRAAGTPIVRFGGTAAGPAVLERLHESCRRLLNKEDGNEITSRIITDLMNLEGKCVVAGNVRRSAEIAFGLADDKDFIGLKDHTLSENADRLNYDDGSGWGHLSNNSVFADIEGDYDHLIPKIEVNGEPGLYFLDLSRSHGRLGDPANDRDFRVAGANPCVEQSLEDQECCTLVETFPTNCDDFEDFRRTIKVAYLYAKAVTLLPTHWPETNEVMQRNRRIGCSASGLAQFVERHGWTTLRQWLDGGYHEVTSRDRQYAEWLGVRESIKMTSVKPSGTVSLLAGVTPGVHWPPAGEDYLRRVRYSKDAAFLPVLEAAGYHIEPSVADPDADVVVTYPTSGPQVRSEREVPVWEKMHLAAMLQEVWADNMVSATFSFLPSETVQIGPAIHAFKGKLKAMSFLPMGEGGGAYQQMPYEAVDHDAFAKARAGVGPIDAEALYTIPFDAIGERYCSNDSCEIPKPT